MTQGTDYASLAADIVKTMLAQGHVKDPTQIPGLLTQIGQNLRALGSDQPAPAVTVAAPAVAASTPGPAAVAPADDTKPSRPARERKAGAPRAPEQTLREPTPAPAPAPLPAEAQERREQIAPEHFVEGKDLRPVSITGQKPAVPIRSSVTPDWIICLEDGRKMKMLKRHLNSAYGMSPEEYRAKWELPENYPMVAPNYAKMKSKYARHVGLGTHRMRVEVAEKRELEQV